MVKLGAKIQQNVGLMERYTLKHKSIALYRFMEVRISLPQRVWTSVRCDWWYIESWMWQWSEWPSTFTELHKYRRTTKKLSVEQIHEHIHTLRRLWL